MAKLPREICRRCGQFKPVLASGVFRAHTKTKHYLNAIGRIPCQGSGKKPADVLTYLEAIALLKDG